MGQREACLFLGGGFRDTPKRNEMIQWSRQDGCRRDGKPKGVQSSTWQEWEEVRNRLGRVGSRAILPLYQEHTGVADLLMVRGRPSITLLSQELGSLTLECCPPLMCPWSGKEKKGGLKSPTSVVLTVPAAPTPTPRLKPCPLHRVPPAMCPQLGHHVPGG